jgi:hypothetical protein
MDKPDSVKKRRVKTHVAVYLDDDARARLNRARVLGGGIPRTLSDVAREAVLAGLPAVERAPGVRL